MKALTVVVHELWAWLKFLCTRTRTAEADADFIRPWYDNSSPDIRPGELKSEIDELYEMIQNVSSEMKQMKEDMLANTMADTDQIQQ